MTKQTAKTIVERIITDLEDRGGLQNEWEQIDPEIQQEIRDEWIHIVMEAK